ncbi:hypothetical protein AWQ21_15515 (plasmid) [Picosynechococcus sp. PCC 7003]|uniref:CHASE2 domain-containing protein n=1 Tax=Picosynechococcus sp. PCC 7003 TaxID=374981 RepID=UPI000810E15D|nr:CHASE2 domain-containing protein [Picosynechococcus sp. PCC 7003]ANV85933.1 hypothetical protein AWQ21_15515 [Picosynechococcus sp. PCC 7003]
MAQRLIILKIITGSFKAGFTVALDVEQHHQGQIQTCLKDYYGHLPPLPENLNLEQHYHAWLETIRTAPSDQAQTHRGIKVKSKQAIAKRYEAPRNQSRQALQATMAQWLTTSDPRWHDLEKQILQWCQPEQWQTCLVIQISQALYQDNPATADLLGKLPWREWPLLQTQHISLALNTRQYGEAPLNLAPKTARRQYIPWYRAFFPRTRILHLIGDSGGLDLKPDQRVLAQLKDAEIVTLQSPSYGELSRRLRDPRGFDLLIYSGHSEACYDEDLAAMLLSEADGVTIQDLQRSFQKAIANGLQFALFNSCASSQLAETLLNYGLKTIISMQAEIPDPVAHHFIERFFVHYAQGKLPLFRALGETLIDLEEYDQDYPGVAWLPLMHHNPSTVPPRWTSLRSKPRSIRRQGLVGIGAIAVTLALRSLGLLQPLDLKLFDLFLRSQPFPKPETERVVVVTIDPDDLDILRQNGLQVETGDDVIADAALADVLEKIQAYEPRWLGLDIIRDLPIADAGTAQLQALLQSSEQLFVTCGFPDETGNEQLPPPGIDPAYLSFNNFPIDPDRVIRRQLLYLDPLENSTCNASQSLAFSLALNYLSDAGIVPMDRASLTWNDAVFPALAETPGSYLNQRRLGGGYQILFRPQPRGYLREISITTLYADSDQRLNLKDKVVLLGYRHKDLHRTAFGPEIPGVVIQGQMVQQFLDGVLENQPQLWVLAPWGEMLWLVAWGVIPSFGIGLLLIFGQSQGKGYGLLLGCGIVGSGFAWFVLKTWGLWLPLGSPLVLLLALFGGTIIAARTRES